MRATILISFVFIFGLSNLFAQKTVKENYKITGFNSISVSSGFDLYITQGNSESVTIEVDKKKLDKVKVQKIGNTLKIYMKNNFGTTKILKAYVTVKNIDEINGSGGADIYSQNTLKAKYFDLDLSGGADAELDLNVNELEVDISGGADAEISGIIKKLEADASGGADLIVKGINATDCDIEVSGGSDIKLKGKTINFKANASGAGDIEADDLITENANVCASSGSDIELNVSKTLSAQASGGGAILYHGKPKVKDLDISVSGTFRNID